MAMPLRVTGSWVQLLTDWLDQEGLPAPELRNLLDSRGPADIVPLPVWQAMLQRAVSLRPALPAPGLAIGALIQPRHVGVLGYLILASTTLGQALQAYQRYESLFYGLNVMQVQPCGDWIRVQWPADASTGALADTVAIAAMLTFLRRLVALPPVPAAVYFAFARPSPADCLAYEAFFGCAVHFAAKVTAVELPIADLHQGLPHSDAAVLGLLDQQAQAMLLALPDGDHFDRALQQAMVRLMSEGELGLPRVAAELHVSVRTLQRRLEQRQSSWRALLDRTREQLAGHYLRDPALTLGDIALLLGFSEQSAFNRAFHRWTGTTPARARRDQHLP
ncbi:MAG: AraC family transcriptional regulator ligand-binding domain-containing protein [Halopseudomonas sp.]